MANNLFFEGIKYLQKKAGVKWDYRKLNKYDSHYNRLIVQLGKKFKDLGLENESATKYLDEIKSIDEQISHQNEEIALLDKQKDEVKLDIQKAEHEFNEEHSQLDKKLKEIHYSVNKIKEKQKDINNELISFHKEIKQLDNDNKDMQKQLAQIHMDPGDSENPQEALSEDTSLMEKEIQDNDSRMQELAKEIEKKEESIAKTKEELQPVQSSQQELNEEMTKLKMIWKTKKSELDHKVHEFQKKIDELESQKKSLSENKVLPYRELGIVVMDSDIRSEELTSIYQKLHKTTKDIDQLKKEILVNEEYLNSNDAKKAKYINWLVAGLFIAVIILVYYLFTS